MTEGKRAVIFVGAVLNVLLLNQPVTSNLKADPGINDNWIVSRVYERFGHPNSSIANRGEVRRHRSDVSRFRREPSEITANLYSPARFSFTGRSEERFQFERQRRIFRERYNNRQERNRVIQDDPVLHEYNQRRTTKMDLDNGRYFRYSEVQSDRNIPRSTIFLPKSRFLNSESTATLTTLNGLDRRIDSRIRDTRNSEFMYRTREFGRNVNQFRNRGTRLMRTIEADRDQTSNRVRSENSETSSLAYSFLKSTLFQYFPHNSIPSFESYQINDFVVSTIAGILLYDIMGAMMQNKAVFEKKEYFGNIVEKMVFAVRKMVAH